MEELEEEFLDRVGTEHQQKPEPNWHPSYTLDRDWTVEEGETTYLVNEEALNELTAILEEALAKHEAEAKPAEEPEPIKEKPKIDEEIEPDFFEIVGTEHEPNPDGNADDGVADVNFSYEKHL